jgi:hypothetical protein
MPVFGSHPLFEKLTNPDSLPTYEDLSSLWIRTSPHRITNICPKIDWDGIQGFVGTVEATASESQAYCSATVRVLFESIIDQVEDVK